MPPQLWAEHDPDAGDWKEEAVHETVKEGILDREMYLSAWVCGEEIRVYCTYSVKAPCQLGKGWENPV